MASRDIQKAWTSHKGEEPWTALNVHIFIITIDLNMDSWSRSIVNEPIGLLISVQGMLMDEFWSWTSR